MTETKSKISSILKSLENYNNEYQFDKLDDIVTNINKGLDLEHRQVRKIICKYCNVNSNGCIVFDVKNASNMDYKTIKTNIDEFKLKKPIQASQPTQPNKPIVTTMVKKKGFGVIVTKDFDDNIVNKDTVDVKKEIIVKTTPMPVKKRGFGVIVKNDSDEKTSVPIKHVKDTFVDNQNTYVYPIEKFVTKTRYEPKGTQWFHDEQVDDVLDDDAQHRRRVFDNLMSIEYPPQRSPEWFKLRENAITASDGGCLLGLDHYSLPYTFILKKLGLKPFESNINCYHGKKYESIATMIYGYRKNVKVEEFGLVVHPKYSYLAASPDGIVGMYKADGIHLTSEIGTMLEIKCVTQRKINTTGPVFGTICPEHYYVQCQLQMEACNLDKCDFWQCKIVQYMDRDDFIQDTKQNEPFISISTGLEKGCLIQLMPLNHIKNYINDDNVIDHNKYNTAVYDVTKFIFPPKVEMSPLDCDIWIAETLQDLHNTYPEYCLDRVFYWKLEKSHCEPIYRDKKWFAEQLPIFTRSWHNIEILRTDKEKADLIVEYIRTFPQNTKSHAINDTIMQAIDDLCNPPDDIKLYKEYSKKIQKIHTVIGNKN